MKFICFLIESVCLFCIEFFEYFYCRDGGLRPIKYFCRRMRQKIAVVDYVLLNIFA